MGKKKEKKSKELSVAIAEAPSAGDAHIQQLQSPRRRGRPRKIFVKTESEEENKEPPALEAKQSEQEAGAIGVKYRSWSKRARSIERRELEKSSGHGRHENKEHEAFESTSLDIIEKEGRGAEAKEAVKTEPPRSRAKRKSRPRKSSSK